MASSSAMTTRVAAPGFLSYDRVSAIRRSSSSSWVCSSRLIWSSTSARWRCIASAWRWASWCSRSASGVSDTSARSRASSAASARCPSCSSDDRQLLAQLLQARADLGETAFDQGPGHRRQCTRPGVSDRICDDAPMARRPSRRRRGAVAGRRRCWIGRVRRGTATSDVRCGPITREALDPAYLVHVLGNDDDLEYTSDPPDLGSPPAGPAGRRAWWTSRSRRPVQVGILERGDVLVQHDPDLDADGTDAPRGPGGRRRGGRSQPRPARADRRDGMAVQAHLRRRRRGRAAGVRRRAPRARARVTGDHGRVGHRRRLVRHRRPVARRAAGHDRGHPRRHGRPARAAGVGRCGPGPPTR